MFKRIAVCLFLCCVLSVFQGCANSVDEEDSIEKCGSNFCSASQICCFDGECLDKSSVNSCGGCGNVCPSGSSCVASGNGYACSCGSGTCLPSQLCCDGMCVSRTTQNCSACGAGCGETSFANMEFKCEYSQMSGYACGTIAECKTGYEDANKDVSDGCELQSSSSTSNGGGKTPDEKTPEVKPSVCGNGIIEAGEACEISAEGVYLFPVGIRSCSDVVAGTNGQLLCDDKCEVFTDRCCASGQTRCGGSGTQMVCNAFGTFEQTATPCSCGNLEFACSSDLGSLMQCIGGSWVKAEDCGEKIVDMACDLMLNMCLPKQSGTVWCELGDAGGTLYVSSRTGKSGLGTCNGTFFEEIISREKTTNFAQGYSIKGTDFEATIWARNDVTEGGVSYAYAKRGIAIDSSVGNSGIEVSLKRPGGVGSVYMDVHGWSQVAEVFIEYLGSTNVLRQRVDSKSDGRLKFDVNDVNVTQFSVKSSGPVTIGNLFWTPSVSE